MNLSELEGLGTECSVTIVPDFSTKFDAYQGDPWLDIVAHFRIIWSASLLRGFQ